VGDSKVLHQPGFPSALGKFIYFLDHPDAVDIPGAIYPLYEGSIHVYHSAIATYYAPSDLCGTGGLHHERIRAVPSFRGERQYDTVFVELDTSKDGLLGMVVARVCIFFSFLYRQKFHFCALVHWYVRELDERDKDTGMWIVHLEQTQGGRAVLDVINAESIVRGAHLLPVYGDNRVPERFSHFNTLSMYKSFFVNHFADHHTNELILG